MAKKAPKPLNQPFFRPPKTSTPLMSQKSPSQTSQMRTLPPKNPPAHPAAQSGILSIFFRPA